MFDSEKNPKILSVKDIYVSTLLSDDRRRSATNATNATGAAFNDCKLPPSAAMMAGVLCQKYLENSKALCVAPNTQVFEMES